MTVTVRFARPDDYREGAHSDASLRFTERLLRSDERSAQLDPHFRRVVATTAGHIVGACTLHSHWYDVVRPGRLWVTIALLPGWRGRGLDSRMLQHGIAGLKADINELATCIREDHLPHMSFLDEFGFEERFRSWGAHLDLETFDPTPFEEEIEELQAAGFSFVPYEDLESEENERRLLELKRELERDVLSFDPIVPSGRSGAMEEDVIAAGLMVALDPQGDFVGMATLRRASPDGGIDSGLTGVRREYRGRGIATALKVRSLAVAKELGATETGTGGGGANAPMKRLNQKLGYRAGPDWVTLLSQR